jgi:hypothetical protein
MGDLAPVSGSVLVTRPGSATFVVLTVAAHVPCRDGRQRDQRQGDDHDGWPTRHECFVPDASVSVTATETAESDENHASGRSLGSLLLFTEAGISADVALGPSQASRLARKAKLVREWTRPTRLDLAQARVYGAIRAIMLVPLPGFEA